MVFARLRAFNRAPSVGREGIVMPYADPHSEIARATRRRSKKRWEQANPEKAREIRRRAGKKTYQKYRDAFLAKRRNQYLGKAYGISHAQYESMFAAQQGRCAICGGEDPKSLPSAHHKNGRFHVDHDHATGKVRALLCAPCNLGIGSFRDDPGLLVAAIAYLQRHATSKPTKD